MKLHQITKTIQMWVSTQPTRDKSFIADIDLADHCPQFWHKCYDVLSKHYTYSQKRFVESVMEFYDDWSYITWKQYDSIMNLMLPAKKVYKIRNIEYYKSRMDLLSRSGQLSFSNYMSHTFNDHVLPFISDDDLIGRFLPTDESMDRMWSNLATSMYPEAGALAHKFGLHW